MKIRKLLPLLIVSVSMIVLLGFEFSRGVISPRALGVIALILSIAIFVWSVRIVKRSAPESSLSPSLQGSSDSDIQTRKRRLLRIRQCEIAIAILALLLVFGILKGGPLLPVLVGASFNLCLMVVLIRVVMRLKKSLS